MNVVYPYIGCNMEKFVLVKDEDNYYIYRDLTINKKLDVWNFIIMDGKRYDRKNY